MKITIEGWKDKPVVVEGIRSFFVGATVVVDGSLKLTSTYEDNGDLAFLPCVVTNAQMLAMTKMLKKMDQGAGANG